MTRHYLVIHGKYAWGELIRDRLMAAIQEFIVAYGHPPTLRELGDAVGLKSPASVSRHLYRLAKQKRIMFTPGAPGRTIQVLDASPRYPGYGRLL